MDEMIVVEYERYPYLMINLVTKDEVKSIAKHITIERLFDFLLNNKYNKHIILDVEFRLEKYIDMNLKLNNYSYPSSSDNHKYYKFRKEFGQRHTYSSYISYILRESSKREIEEKDNGLKYMWVGGKW